MSSVWTPSTWNPLYDRWVRDGLPYKIFNAELLATASARGQGRKRDYEEWTRLARISAEARVECTSTFSWSIPGPQAVSRVVELAADNKTGVVDVMAGTGYWARVLHEAGVDVVATDLLPPNGSEHNGYHPSNVAHFGVLTADAADSALVHAERILFMSWPPFNLPVGARAVEAYHRGGGETVIYVGEGPGGCTGDDVMHFLLGMGNGEYCHWHDCTECMAGETCWLSKVVNEKQVCTCVPSATVPLFEHVETIPVPQWDTIHDDMYVCRRIPTTRRG